MIRGEIPLMTGPLPPCKGADLKTNPEARRRRARGNPTIHVDSNGNTVFSCPKETVTGTCLLADKPILCAIRPIFVAQEHSPIGRRTIAVRGGELDYNPTERLVYNWPNKPSDAEPQTLGEKENTILALLVESHGKLVPSDILLHEIWQDEVPETGTTQLQKHMLGLRTKIGRELIETVRDRGYRLLKPDDAAPND